MQPGAAAGGEERTFIETARRAQIVAAAIDTIANVGYAGALFARIAERLGMSRGLISYHFTGKDDLMKQVVRDVVEKGMAYMRPRILAGSTGPGMLRAYIETNLAFMRENRNALIAVSESHAARTGDASSTAIATWSMRSAPLSICCLASNSGQLRLTSTDTSWQSRFAPRSTPCRPGWPGAGVRHRQLRQGDRHGLRPGDPHRAAA